MNETRVLVCGSRGWTNRALINYKLSWFLEPDSHVVVVHGAARGADTIAAEEAEKLGFEVEEHPAEWHEHGRGAGVLRNEEMARSGADACLAFWDGKSKGTEDMIRRCRAHKIPVTIIYDDEELPDHSG